MNQKLEDRAKQKMRVSDSEGKETGEIASRKECHSSPGKKHIAFLVFVINEKKEFALHKRSASKIGDSLLDSPVSHILAGETTEDAVHRCLKHEYGIEEKLSVTNHGGFSYEKDYGDGTCENEYCFVLSVEYDGSITPNQGEMHGEIVYMPADQSIAESKVDSDKFEIWFNLAVPIFAESEKAKKYLE